MYGPIRTPLLDLCPRYQWDSQAEKYTGNTGLELRHMVGLQRAYGVSIRMALEPWQWVRRLRENLASEKAVTSLLGILDLEELAGEAGKELLPSCPPARGPPY